MFSISIFLFVLAGECLSFNGEPKIVGGFETTTAQVPYVVSLRNKNNHHLCGGTLIDHRHVVTAAHCFPYNGQINHVVIGDDKLKSPDGSKYGISSVVLHPYYTQASNSSALTNDVAVVTLNKKATYRKRFPTRMYRNFSKEDEDENGNIYCYAVGWGLTKKGGAVSNQLKAVRVKVVPEAQCKKGWGKNYNQCLICTTDKNDGTCQGDSGGPLITEKGEKFAGIVSFGLPCATGMLPDMFSAVRCYNNFIDYVVKNDL